MTDPSPPPLSRLLGVARAGRAVDRVLASIRDAARPGTPAADLDALARRILARLGARPAMLGYDDGHGGGPFPTALSVNVNDEIMGACDPARVLRAGDLVTADLAAEIEGWHADAADTWVIGTSPPELAHLAESARAICAAGIAALRPGAAWSSVAGAMSGAAAGRGVALLRGYDAHGVGRAMHQPPRLPMHPDDAGRLDPPGWSPRPGDIITIEPVVVGHLDSGIVREGWLDRTGDGSPACFVEATVAVGATRNLVLAGRCWQPGGNDLRPMGA